MTRATYHQSFIDSGHVDVTGKKLNSVNYGALGVVTTPSPAPGVNESPFMTWGEIDGTPFRLDASDINPVVDNAPKFKIPELPVRERIAHDIVEKITHCYHGKRRQAIHQVQKITPKTPYTSLKNSDKLILMSPAAKRFATNKLGISIGTEKIKINTKKTPISTRSIFSPAICKMVKTKKEPSTPNISLTSTKKSVTDNLFNLPTSPNHKMLIPELASNKNFSSKKTRPTATDFF